MAQREEGRTMKRISGLLWVFIVIELAICGRWIVPRLSRTIPPQVALDELDDGTATAIKELQTAAIDGGAPEWQELAEAYLSEGFFPQAEVCFAHAATQESQNEQILYGQGFCLEKMGRTESATAIFRQLLDSKEAQLKRTCWYQIGRNLLREEKLEEAEAAFRQIAEFPPAAYQLAKLLIRTDRVEEGVSLVEHQLTHSPNSLKFHQLLAYAAESQENEALAWQLHQRALRAEYVLTLEYSMSYIGLFRGRYGIQRQLAECLQLKSTGSLDERADCLERGIESIEQNRLLNYQTVYLAAAQVAVGQNQPEKALYFLETLKSQQYQTPEVVELWGDVHQLLGDSSQARRDWRSAASQVPNSERLRKLAQSFAESGDQAAANRHESQSLFYAGAESFRHNQLDTAVHQLEQSAELDEMNPNTWFYLGRVRQALNETEAAILAYQRCLALVPHHGRAQDALNCLDSKNVENSTE